MGEYRRWCSCVHSEGWWTTQVQFEGFQQCVPSSWYPRCQHPYVPSYVCKPTCSARRLVNGGSAVTWTQEHFDDCYLRPPCPESGCQACCTVIGGGVIRIL